MKTFSQYLSEGTKPNMSQSDVNGKIHEVLVAKHLNGGKHVSAESQKLHADLKSSMHPDRYNDEVKKAKVAAEGIKKHLGDKGIKKVGIVSKAGDIGRFTGGKHNLSQQQDASDLMVQHHDGSHTGISLKSSQEHNAAVGFHNEGHGAVDKRLGVSTKHHIHNMKQEIVNKHHELSGMTDSAAKEHLKKDDKAAATATEAGKKALHNIAGDWHAAYQKMDSKTRAEHLRHVLHAQKPEIPHIRSTTSGLNGDHRNHIIEPGTHHDKYINDHKNIKVERAGNSGLLWTHHDPKTGKVTKLANERAKFSSGVASSVKTSVN